MSTDPNPNPNPNPTPPAPAGDPNENSTIRQMREQIAAAQLAAKEAADAKAAAEAKLTEIERAKLDENERLKLELADERKKTAEAAALRDENGRFTSAFENLYKSELESVPEEKRPIVESLSRQGSWPDRLEALRNTRALIGTAAAPPAAAGSTTKPAGTTPPPGDPPTPKPYDPKHPPSWADAFRSSKKP